MIGRHSSAKASRLPFRIVPSAAPPAPPFTGGALVGICTFTCTTPEASSGSAARHSNDERVSALGPHHAPL